MGQTALWFHVGALVPRTGRSRGGVYRVALQQAFMDMHVHDSDCEYMHEFERRYRAADFLAARMFELHYQAGIEVQMLST